MAEQVGVVCAFDSTRAGGGNGSGERSDQAEHGIGLRSPQVYTTGTRTVARSVADG
jgi:hypothetical protein